MGNYLITMPDVGEGIAEVEVIEWNVKIGAQIEEDDLLCTVMTDKANVEIPCPVDGTITWLAVDAGDVMAVGADFIRLQVEGEGNTDSSAPAAATPAQVSAPEPAAQPETPVTDRTSTSDADGNYLIAMPDVGEGIAEVEIVEWNVKIGDSIEEDDLLCTVMTDKASVEIPCPIDGTVTWLAVNAGEVMAVGADFIRLQVAGSGNSNAPATASVQQPAAAPAPAPAPAPPVAVSHGAVRAEGDKPVASPAVRQRARNVGVDLRFVRGTGPADRISHHDLDAYIAGTAAPVAAFTSGPVADTSIKEVKVMGLRRKIAAIMQDTMQRIPHFTYVEEIDVTELELLRAKLNRERRDDQPKLTMLPFFIKALTKALKVYPEMGSRFDDQAEMVYQYSAAHVGIATQTDNGLVVPVVKHAEILSIWQTADEIKRLSTVARAGKATREELGGSTITISSLGPMGGIVTTPVINSPEVAILGVNKVAKRPTWKDGGFVPRDIMNLSSSFDHRIIDGWEATLFIQHIKGLLESPASLFMED